MTFSPNDSLNFFSKHGRHLDETIRWGRLATDLGSRDYIVTGVFVHLVEGDRTTTRAICGSTTPPGMVWGLYKDLQTALGTEGSPLVCPTCEELALWDAAQQAVEDVLGPRAWTLDTKED